MHDQAAAAVAAVVVVCMGCHVVVLGPFTRVQIRVRFPVRFHAQFADRDPILYLTSIKT
jgi:hypothetical protein